MENERLARFRELAQDSLKRPFLVDASELGDYLLQALDEIASLREQLSDMRQENERLRGVAKETSIGTR